MAKKGTSDLYRLIKELTPHEKAYFKKFARQHSSQGTDYLKLFEAIDAAKEYDDKALSKQFKYFAYLKNYLFKLLLNTLVNYYNNPRQTQMHLINRYMNAVVLEKKGFTQHAIKELKQGKTMAAQNNYPLLEYMFALSYYRLQRSIMPINKRKKYLQTSYEGLSGIINAEVSQLKYRFEYDKLILLSTQNTQGTDDPILESEINFELLSAPPQSATLAEMRSYHEVMLAYYFSLRDFTSAYSMALEYLKLEKRHLKDADNDFYNYSQALAFCMVTSTELSKTAEAEKHLEAIFKVKSPNKRINAHNLSRYVAYKLILLAATRRYVQGATFALQAQKKYPQLFNITSPHYNPLVCHSLYVLFMNRNYKDCMELLNDVDLVDIRKNAIYSYKDLEMLRLMLQAELGNYQLMGNLTRAVSAKLKRYNLEDEYVKELLTFFKSMPQSLSEPKKRVVVNRLNSITNANPDKHMSYFFLGVAFYQEWIKTLKPVPAETN